MPAPSDRKVRPSAVCRAPLDLGPGRMLSKVQSYVRRVSGVYRDAEAQQADVDTLYRGAMSELERLGVVKGMSSDVSDEAE